MNALLINLLLILFVIVTWGYSWVLMKEALDYMGPLTFVGVRCMIGALTLMPIAYWMNSSRSSAYRFRDYLIIGIFQTTAMFALVIYGMKYVTAGKSAVFLYTMPIWTSFLVHFLLREKLTGKQWLGLVLGFTGILFILGWDTLTTQNIEIVFGEFLIILAAISWAIANIIMRQRLPGEKPSTLTAFQLFFGSLVLIAMAAGTENLLDITLTPYSVYILLFTGIIASAINFSIWFYLIKNIDINITTFSSMLVPVFGLVFDRLLLGTSLDTGVIVGGIFILFGIYRISNR